MIKSENNSESNLQTFQLHQKYDVRFQLLIFKNTFFIICFLKKNN